MRLTDMVPIVFNVARLARWRAASKKPLDIGRNYHPANDDRFMSAARAASLIHSYDVLVLTGLGATGWTPAMMQAIAARHSELLGLTLIAIAGQGGRDRLDGSGDDLALYPGLLGELITGHAETFRRCLKAAERDKRLKISLIPQGALSRLIQAKAQGMKTFRTKAGIGTFVDPRWGTGTIVANTDKQWVRIVDGELEYDCPDNNMVVIINATAVDDRGNVYVHECALLGEMKNASLAAKRHGGKVIVQCGSVQEYRPDEIYIPGNMVDAIVVRPETPQTLCYTQRRPNRSLVVGSKADLRRSLAIVKAINRVAGFTPKRSKDDLMLAKAAAVVVADSINGSHNLIVGVGMPEEAAVQLALAGVLQRLRMMVESGPIGGIAASGALFGCMFLPEELVESCEAFARIESGEGGIVAVLGALEIDFRGNVNLSRKAKGILGTVGPGGSTVIIDGAKTIVFVMHLFNGKSLRVVENVSEVTFSASQALNDGKEVYYVTDVGVFYLTKDGLELINLMPGVSLKEARAIMPFDFKAQTNVSGLETNIALRLSI